MEGNLEKTEDTGSGAILIHSKQNGDKDPKKNWEKFQTKLTDAMQTLNDPTK